MSRGTIMAVMMKMTAQRSQVLIQMINMAFCSDERTAISPAISGAAAEPPSSIKYCTERAVLRTSGKVMSCTVAVTLGAAKGIKKAVQASRVMKSPG